MAADDLYQGLQLELQQCRNTLLPEARQTECAYQVSARFWRQLREQLNVHCFSGNQEEIHFFKCVKPKFTSLLLYFELVYHV